MECALHWRAGAPDTFYFCWCMCLSVRPIIQLRPIFHTLRDDFL